MDHASNDAACRPTTTRAPVPIRAAELAAGRGRRIPMAALALVFAGAGSAQSGGGDYALTREVVAGGGTRATGGDFTAVTTTAQAVLGTQSGGDFVVRGGFHLATAAATPPVDAIFTHGFEN